MKKTIFVVAVAVILALLPGLSAGSGSSTHWGYEGHEGPEYWGELSEEYHLCSSGRQQSPVDLKGEVQLFTGGLTFDYAPSSLRVINNGHTIQANIDGNSYLRIAGRDYKLLQFHFHHPSENIHEGKAYPMEVHLVHKDDRGNLAVVGVFFNESTEENTSITKVWKAIPDSVNNENKVSGQTVSPLSLLPSNKTFYHFMGSLTTPPCSEGVKWYVMKEPISISRKQIIAFKDIIGENARPVQPVNDRTILEVDVK